MKPYLLDTNLLIALSWPSHVHHRGTQRWFARTRAAGFRTCPLTQTAFVRISSNAKFSPDAVLPRDAMALLASITELSEHEFWPDDLTLADAIATTDPIVGHRQITEAYLLALARARGGILATLDRGTLALAHSDRDSVELLDDL